MTCCGRCSHFTRDHRCDNPRSKEYGEQQFSNVYWKCPDFDENEDIKRIMELEEKRNEID